jgi:DNA-directed RNA polymerase subunit K/omega
MDYRRIRTDNSAVTRDLNDFDKDTENIYESMVILSKRANQISSDLKEELAEKMQDFSTGSSDSSEEFFENKEQIELARGYEQMPKPSLIAIQEFLKGQIYYRLPEEIKQREMAH